jgi:RecA/RadA recombinase
MKGEERAKLHEPKRRSHITTLGLRPDAKIRECLPTGVAPLDAIIEGFPRGAISEILGPHFGSANATGLADNRVSG